MKIFSVYDSKAEGFTRPIFTNTEAEAVRAFGACCRDPEHAFAKDPGDYTLYEIGQWDERSAEIHNRDNNRIGSALEYLQQTDAIMHDLKGEKE